MKKYCQQICDPKEFNRWGKCSECYIASQKERTRKAVRALLIADNLILRIRLIAAREHFKKIKQEFKKQKDNAKNN